MNLNEFNEKKEAAVMLGAIKKEVLLAVAFASSFAATDTDPFQVTATVLSSCEITASDLAFGDYDPASAVPTDGSSTVTVNCTLLTPYTVTLNVGIGSGAAYDTGRKMTGISNNLQTLLYNLYSDAGHTTVWGDGTTGGSVDVDGVGLGPLINSNHTVYGRITAQQNVQAQSYSDTVTATITY